jgi:HAD superfamily hydrolase (TIGR01509 family)
MAEVEHVAQAGIELVGGDDRALVAGAGEDDVVELFLGRSTAALLSHYKDDRRFVAETFLPALKARVLQRFGEQLSPIPGIQAVVSQLESPSCVASSSDLDRVVRSLELTGLAPLFDGRLYTAQMVARGKPAPDLFLYAADKMRAAPRRTLVIEDSVSGVTAAKAAGMTAWGFVGGSHYASRDARAMLYDAGADRVFERMTDFSGEE